MTLKSWSIAEFTGASGASPVSTDLIDSGSGTVILLSLIVANRGADSAQINVERVDASNTVLFGFDFTLAPSDAPFAMTAKTVFADGHKLKITSNRVDITVDASGDES